MVQTRLSGIAIINMLNYVYLQTFEFLLWKYLHIYINRIYVIQWSKQRLSFILTIINIERSYANRILQDRILIFLEKRKNRESFLL